ncbi:translation initiation factor IF-2 [Drosophila sechellia]|uniref:GM12653 n=1 Tax=Drosophila sechellia TaxID=7238 RepID=B4I0R5_DROSE|nr:translation initiation factor IF-2 [Drosophila sechellia]EDW53096.1 GM12653 [Drosophila sechellia]
MSKAQQLMDRDQQAARAKEEARRKRAEMRQSYGNKFSSINLHRMRQKQTTSAGDAAHSKKEAVETMPTTNEKDDPTLRRIASSFEHVRDLVSGSTVGLPLEDGEDDAREERTEVLIFSQTMPPPDELPVDFPSPGKSETQWEPELQSQSQFHLEPEPQPHPEPPSTDTAAAAAQIAELTASVMTSKVMPDLPPTESRAFERWQHLGSTVSALFRARRNIDTAESPKAQTRRLREQRELLEAFTRPFLYDAYRRE